MAVESGDDGKLTRPVSVGVRLIQQRSGRDLVTARSRFNNCSSMFIGDSVTSTPKGSIPCLRINSRMGAMGGQDPTRTCATSRRIATVNDARSIGQMVLQASRHPNRPSDRRAHRAAFCDEPDCRLGSPGKTAVASETAVRVEVGDQFDVSFEDGHFQGRRSSEEQFARQIDLEIFNSTTFRPGNCRSFVLGEHDRIRGADATARRATLFAVIFLLDKNSIQKIDAVNTEQAEIETLQAICTTTVIDHGIPATADIIATDDHRCRWAVATSAQPVVPSDDGFRIGTSFAR